MEPTMTVEGRLGSDPELRFTARGDAVATFDIANTRRVKRGDEWEDGPTSWFRVTCWKRLAEHVADQARKGDLVLVHGNPEIETYEKDGENRKAFRLTARSVGLVLDGKWTVTRGTAAPHRPDPEIAPW